MSRNLVVVAALLASVLRGAAYPIAPVSLDNLILGSDLIVHAVVEGGPERVTARPMGLRPGFQGTMARSKLRILEVLKGEHADPFVLVDYHTRICPAGPSFPPDEEMMVFLTRIPPGLYTTVGLSYGAVAVSAREAAVYREAVKGLLAIAAGNPLDKDKATAEWLVKMVESPVTRTDAALSLLSPRYRNDPGARTTLAPQYAPFLTAAHWTLISNAVVRTEILTEGDFMFIDFLKIPANEQVEVYLRTLKNLRGKEEGKTIEENFRHEFLMKRTLKELGDLLPTFSQQDILPSYRSAALRGSYLDRLIPRIEKAAREQGYMLKIPAKGD